MINNGNPSQIAKLVDGRWAREAAWAQKACVIPCAHTKHCWALSRQVFLPSVPGKDGDTQLRFTVTILPAGAVGLGALEGSGGTHWQVRPHLGGPHSIWTWNAWVKQLWPAGRY